MASQQRVPQVKDEPDHHHHRQQPHTDAEQLQAHLSQLDIAIAEAVHFADLPGAWFCLLITELPPFQHSALLGTCKTVAAAVVQHSSRLTLTPDEALQHDSTRRTFVLRLASKCDNVCLKVGPRVCPLDVVDIWPCIKQLRLVSTGFTAEVINSLHLQQLAQLHTLECVGWNWLFPANFLDVQAAQRLLQPDSLPALRTVACMDLNACRTLQQLKPYLGHKVTLLVVGNSKAVAAIKGWAALRAVQYVWNAIHWDGSHNKEAVRQIFDHPRLRRAAVPASMFSTAFCTSSIKRKLDLLELETDPGPAVVSLQNLARHAAMQLQLRGGIQVAEDLTVADVQQLQQCCKVKVTPGRWATCGGAFDSSSIPHSTTTWAISFKPVLLSWLLPMIGNTAGTILLSSSVVGAGNRLGKEHIESLNALPPGIRVLAIENCALIDACTWEQFLAHVPQQVLYLLVRRCAITCDSFKAFLAQAPPAGLQRLYLAQDRRFMPWVKERHVEVKALLATSWPGVDLELNLHACQEDTQDYSDDYYDWEEYDYASSSNETY